MSENLNLKIRLKSLTRGQFHQRYAREFFVQKSFQQLFSSYMYLEKAAEKTFVRKFVRKMLMKLAPNHCQHK